MKISIPKNEKAQAKPTNYFFVTDLSGSMWGSVDQLKATLRSLKDLVAPGDTFSLAYFSSFGDFDWISKGSTFTNGLDKIIEEKVYARGLTCFTQVLNSLETVVKDVTTLTGNDNNVFYFLTDGYPNDRSPEREILSISEKLQNVFVHKQVVGYSGYYNRPLLIEMAEKMGGAFNHVSDFSGMKKSCAEFVGVKKTVKKIDLPRCFDLIWQVTDKEIIPLVCKDKSVEVLETNADGELFALDYDELDKLPEDQLVDGKFTFSLAFILSQKNKANLGVALLRKAGAVNVAKTLQKSFTVLQKGYAENLLKEYALEGLTIQKQELAPTILINDFLATVKGRLGKISIDLANSPYKSITRKGTDVSKVTFETTDKVAKITNIVGNENRANISFQTVRRGQVTEINDADLKARVDEFNKTAANKIVFPIPGDTFRNYTLVANGDFNFDRLVIKGDDGDSFEIRPSADLDLFDENQKNITINEFTNLYKALIAEKAHASVLNYYIKTNSVQKHADDLRVSQYGAEGAELLKEIGFDYAMRFSPPTAYKAKDETADYIPFLEITGQLKGAAKISAKDSYAKYVKDAGKNVAKKNPGDEICWPLFKKYDALLASLGKENFVELCQKTVEGVDDTADLLSQKVSTMKFFLMITNSWFEGVDKADEFEHDGLVIKTKEVNEYL